uniref:U6 snRNA-associated Sm-like protein LSm8 n=2 Tax=Caenorhabditis japonica TaxID=281687 RepID=A0A8R1IC34_CAEJA
MTSSLESYMNRMVNVVTGDGRIIIGLLKGFDQLINLVIEDAHERSFSETEGVLTTPLGLYIIRGENVPIGAFFPNFLALGRFENFKNECVQTPRRPTK